MVVLRAVAAAFSMFSVLPVPKVAWSDRTLRWCLLAFPLVGGVIGGACWGFAWVCAKLEAPALIQGAGLTLLPVFLTGGIHLDGYADTCDALASHAPPEKKREILKDPHIGTFAVIRVAAYLIASFALWSSLPVYRGLPLLCGFMLSRALSALALVTFPLARGAGLARTFSQAADRRALRPALMGTAAILCIAMTASGGWSMVLAAGVVFVQYAWTAVRAFHGTSGDLAGWFLQKAEFWMLVFYFAGQSLTWIGG